MAQQEERKPYWRQTKVLMAVCVAPAVAALVGIPYWIGFIQPMSILGLPIGYLLALHGAVIGGIAVIARFSTAQDNIDRWHGTHEDA